MSSKEARRHHPLLRNIRLKLGALALALVSWYAINGIISNEIRIDAIPVSIQVSPGWALVDSSSETADVRFRGSQADVRSLRRDNVQVMVDVRGRETEGVLTVPIRLDHVRTAGGARAVWARPEFITLTLDREHVVSLPVKVELVGDPPPGYSTGSVRSTPATVQVSGPLSQLEKVDQILTLPVDVSGRVQPFQARAGLLPPHAVWEVRMQPERVTVDVELVERSSTVDFPGIPVRTLTRGGHLLGLGIQPDVVTVQLKGQPEVLRNINPADIQAFVDCTGLNSVAEYELPVRIHVPVRVSVEKVDPPLIGVTVSPL